MEYWGFLKVEINCSSFNGENAISLNLKLNYCFGSRLNVMEVSIVVISLMKILCKVEHQMAASLHQYSSY